jgi:hypothetical protein
MDWFQDSAQPRACDIAIEQLFSRLEAAPTRNRVILVVFRIRCQTWEMLSLKLNTETRNLETL